MELERSILAHLLETREFTRKALPHLKPEYFIEAPERIVFEAIKAYALKYHDVPSKEALLIEISAKSGAGDKRFAEAEEIARALRTDKSTSVQWITDSAEKFCQDRALYLALSKGIELTGDESGKGMTAIGIVPKLMQDALAITFDSSVGHDYLDDAEARYMYYHDPRKKVPFALRYFNKITKNGVTKKTITVIMGGTGGGKTMMMCHFAADHLMMGKNVLYITMEIAQEEIAKRIDANLLNVSLDDLELLPKDVYLSKVENVKKKCMGRLIVKEYPNGSASAIHFESLMEELKAKKDFIPDVVYIDYLNICASSRLSGAERSNSYGYSKSIAEELRELAQRRDIAIITGTQTNRSGLNSSDPALDNTSESVGVPFTADLMFVLVTPEELGKRGQMMIKQLKNRFRDENLDRRFLIGVDKNHMRLFDLEESAQRGLMGGSDDNEDQEPQKTSSFAASKKNQQMDFKGFKFS